MFEADLPRLLPDQESCVAQEVNGPGSPALCRMRLPAGCSAVQVSRGQYFCRHPERATFIERFNRKRELLRDVLCIDDDADIRRIAKHALERVGMVRAHLCDDPRNAQAMARSVRPDLILLDLVMPHLDGRAVFELIQADPELARIPVVFFSAYLTRTSMEELMRRGAAGVIAKPFDVQQLVDHMIEIWCERTP